LSGKVTPSVLKKWKKEGRKIVALTAYDHSFARILDTSGVDVILVGDSLGMVIMGLPDTVGVEMDDMVHHTTTVCRAVERALVVTDLPFLSYHLSVSQALENAGRLLQQGGCQAVKLEGCRPKIVETLVDAGIPVMGHIGLAPQSVRLSGGYRVAGKSVTGRSELIDQAKELEHAGCFAIVLECILPEPAKAITASISVPTIGIGSGKDCDGQILVINDMLGLTTRTSKFVRRYASLGDEIHRAVRQFADDVIEGTFPASEESYEEK